MLGVTMVLAVVLAGCEGFSCWVGLSGTTTSERTTTTRAASEATEPTTDDDPPTTDDPTTTIRGSTTTLAATTTAPPTTVPASATTIRPTTTTLSALDAYRAAMRAWVNDYGADMEAGYIVLSKMRNPLSPSPEEKAAARALADLMDGLVADLAAIQAPADLAPAHADYLAALRDMHAGVDKLADAFENGGFTGAVNITRALTAIYGASEDMERPQATLEQALGFSIT
jgi:hypothetical protein